MCPGPSQIWQCPGRHGRLRWSDTHLGCAAPRPRRGGRDRCHCVAGQCRVGASCRWLPCPPPELVTTV
ncbi:hypothetical protein ACFFX0_24135 [Citricoccus parietis]|uniref:Uncharacterized protein n=1 Tax=Citricoccus parietis TaxID=592307 RepID=A0ABV5G594_9MICC